VKGKKEKKKKTNKNLKEEEERERKKGMTNHARGSSSPSDSSYLPAFKRERESKKENT
jgi:hypothetical protein